MEIVADYIVVGAGPVGLLAALGIARMSASLLVLDADNRLNDSPRAMTYTDPTLQLTDRLGILDACKAIALRNRHINFLWPKDDLVVTIDTVKANPERIHPENLQFGQEALGQIAMDALLQLPNTEVRFGQRAPDRLNQQPCAAPSHGGYRNEQTLASRRCRPVHRH